MSFKELQDQVNRRWPKLGRKSLGLFRYFMSLFEELFKENEELKARVKQLENQLATNSINSSKPPSQDGLHASSKRKDKSLRERSGKNPGGQLGHKGHKAELVACPDEVIVCGVEVCPECHTDLRAVESDVILRRQVQDIPPVVPTVTEYQIEVKTCPCCQVQWESALCPKDVTCAFEYGPRVKAMSVYMSGYQFIPAFRVKQMLSLFGIDLSVGTLDNFRKRASKNLTGFMGQLRSSVAGASAGFFDETGIKVDAERYWVHVAATDKLSFFGLHASRGREAHQSMGILPSFKGILHRDDYRSYHDYPQATHSLCCAHLLRDLKFAIECDGQAAWADPLIKLLLKIKEHTQQSPDQVVEAHAQQHYRRVYDELIQMGLRQNPPILKKDGSYRKTGQTKTVNLLLRLKTKQQEVLRFMTHQQARFDNNQAERDLRMNKVRQKVSGGFRSFQAGQEFMHIRSFIATAVKQGADIIEELVNVFTPNNTQYMRLACTPE